MAVKILLQRGTDMEMSREKIDPEPPVVSFCSVFSISDAYGSINDGHALRM